MHVSYEFRIREWVETCGRISAEKGFHGPRGCLSEGDREPATVKQLELEVCKFLLLIVTEVAEAQEAIREGNLNSDLKSMVVAEDGKIVGFASEMADIAIRVFDLAYQMDLDLEAVILKKVEYNANRPHKHGKRF